MRATKVNINSTFYPDIDIFFNRNTPTVTGRRIDLSIRYFGCFSTATCTLPEARRANREDLRRDCKYKDKTSILCYFSFVLQFVGTPPAGSRERTISIPNALRETNLHSRNPLFVRAFPFCDQGLQQIRRDLIRGKNII